MTDPKIQAVKEFFPPTANDKARLGNYNYFEQLFLGQHFEAFAIKIDSQQYKKDYARLKYVACNFAGLLSKVMADMLFSEPPTISTEEGDQEFLDNLAWENKLQVQFYESALGNSYFGDGLFKVRIGKRRAVDPKPTVIIEDITPKIYFPNIDGYNVRQEPDKITLAWTLKIGDKEYLRKEIHEPRKIHNELWLLKGNEIAAQANISELGIEGLQEEEDTKIDDLLVIHVPNWKTGATHFGISDYNDLTSLFYAINNRMTKTENILDKHSDPILALPEGVLDEEGQVKKSQLHMFEVPDGAGDKAKPEYIVWNASLENNFKHIEKLVEMLFMTSEVSPDILGMGQGQSESGRALKLKLLRTIAKSQRKRLYYDHAIKQTLLVAQRLAKAHGAQVMGKTLSGEPVVPDLEWMDGIPIDEMEQVELEEKKIDAGLTSKEDAIMRIEGVDEDVAKEKAKKIKEETAIAMPEAGSFGKNPFGGKPPLGGK